MYAYIYVKTNSKSKGIIIPQTRISLTSRGKEMVMIKEEHVGDCWGADSILVFG